ncbi:MAG: class I SAM-dependent methyltransferase [Patescibacteria group bacterium]|nr:class I SAM-dependent methyltransferase [Patescibacteria group bacterium]MDD4304589.1 class I SAM-dependent methyltransferase [Patescibacteria group bacterium]MDD4695624.1 class I SAM-dependent methyltransferase [Patescibacteria group bacterium]
MGLQNIEEYEKYNNLFFKKHLPFYFFINFFISSLHNEVANRIYKKDAKVIDLACGTGNQAIKLAQKGFFVVGLDLSGDMLKIARKKNKSYYNLEFVLGDASRTMYKDDLFDASIISLGLHDMPEEIAELVLKEMKRITKNKGKIFIIEHDESRFSFYYKIINIWESKYFNNYIRRGMKYFLNKVQLVPVYEKNNIFKTLKVIECLNNK